MCVCMYTHSLLYITDGNSCQRAEVNVLVPGKDFRSSCVTVPEYQKKRKCAHLPTCNRQPILAISKSHFLPIKYKNKYKYLTYLRYLQIIWIKTNKQRNKQAKPPILINKREMWKYDLKD